MYKKIVTAAILTATLSACGGSNSGSSEAISFNLSNANSLALSNMQASEISTKAATHSLIDKGYKITFSDELEEISSVRISAIRIFGDEVFVEVQEDTAISYYVVQRDSSYLKLDVGSMPIHQTNDGKVLFRDGSIYDPSNQTVAPLNSTLVNPMIQAASGNFAIVASYGPQGNQFQIYDTVTKNRFNVGDCNGPRMVALSETKAAIDDCTNEALFDMTDGTRTDIGLIPFNGESLYLGDHDGAYIIGQVASDDNGWQWHLNHLDSTGALTPVITTELNASGECMNCFNKNQELYVSDSWITVKGVDIVTVQNRSTNVNKTILDNLNVLYIDLNGDELTYIAETVQGNSVSGVYNLRTDTDNQHHRDVQLNYIENYN